MRNDYCENRIVSEPKVVFNKMNVQSYVQNYTTYFWQGC